MFTGIIEAISGITSIQAGGGGMFVRIGRPDQFSELHEGNSIAVNGICLTVLRYDVTSFTVEIMQETLHKSNAYVWKSGTRVNLERALRVGDRLDGHFVQGHVDAMLRLESRESVSGTLYLRFSYPAEFRNLLIPQGSIALNGVSLTIAQLGDSSFKTALIGHTIQNSNLSELIPGTMANVEFDVLGKYISRMRSSGSKKLDLEWLNENGF